MPDARVSDSLVRSSETVSEVPSLLIQDRFLLVDPLFTFMMALNVYLTFFRRYNAEQLRRMDWKYLAICYGVPFVPAFVYLFVKDAAGVRVYGSATVSMNSLSLIPLLTAQIWCWVSEEWNIIRIPGFYGPVWYVKASPNVM